jgi:hypothetical protein
MYYHEYVPELLDVGEAIALIGLLLMVAEPTRPFRNTG